MSISSCCSQLDYAEANQQWVNQLKLLTKKQALTMLATVPPQPNHTHIYFVLRKPTHSKQYYKLIDMALENKGSLSDVNIDISYEKIRFYPEENFFSKEGVRCDDFKVLLSKVVMQNKLIHVLDGLFNELTKPIWYVNFKAVEEAGKKMDESEGDLFYVVNDSAESSLPLFTVVSKSGGECRMFYTALTNRGELRVWDWDRKIVGVYESFAKFREEQQISGPIHEASYSKLSSRGQQVANNKSLSSSEP